jgi:hypothetical protein
MMITEDHKSEKNVSVIIVNHNVKDDLEKCLGSLRKQEMPLEVFVVDNASSDASLEMLQSSYSDWSSLKVICNKDNVGFARANNQVISMCSGKYVLLLNPDTVVKDKSLEKMADYLEANPDVGMVGPRLIDADGHVQVSCDRKWTMMRTLLWRAMPYRLSGLIYKNRMEKIYKDPDNQVGWILGAAIMIRNSLLQELKGLDENFFLAADDTADLCKRAQRKGYKSVYYPKAEIIHYGGKSTLEVRPFALLMAYQGHIYYCKKQYGLSSGFIMRITLFAVSLVKMIITALALVCGKKTFKGLFLSHLYIVRKLLFISVPNVRTEV